MENAVLSFCGQCMKEADLKTWKPVTLGCDLKLVEFIKIGKSYRECAAMDFIGNYGMFFACGQNNDIKLYFPSRRGRSVTPQDYGFSYIDIKRTLFEICRNCEYNKKK